MNLSAVCIVREVSVHRQMKLSIIYVRGLEQYRKGATQKCALYARPTIIKLANMPSPYKI